MDVFCDLFFRQSVRPRAFAAPLLCGDIRCANLLETVSAENVWVHRAFLCPELTDDERALRVDRVRDLLDTC